MTSDLLLDQKVAIKLKFFFFGRGRELVRGRRRLIFVAKVGRKILETK